MQKIVKIFENSSRQWFNICLKHASFLTMKWNYILFVRQREIKFMKNISKLQIPSADATNNIWITNGFEVLETYRYSFNAKKNWDNHTKINWVGDVYWNSNSSNIINYQQKKTVCRFSYPHIHNKLLICSYIIYNLAYYLF